MKFKFGKTSCFKCPQPAVWLPRVKNRPITAKDDNDALIELSLRLKPNTFSGVHRRQRAMTKACDHHQALICCNGHREDAVAEVNKLLKKKIPKGEEFPAVMLIPITPILIDVGVIEDISN